MHPKNLFEELFYESKTTTLETIQEELDKVSNDLEVAQGMDIREELKFQLVLELADKKNKLINAFHKAIDDKYLER